MRFSPRFVLCTLVVLLVAASAHAQAPTSGAMLTISGTVGSTPVNIMIYDSQIHSGVVQSVSGQGSCGSGDAAVMTDAYVLQGGSATGCDRGDAHEVTDGNTNVPHQSPGIKDITKSDGQRPDSVVLPGTGFHIETHYLCGPSTAAFPNCGPGISFTGSACNTSGTICANPDTGFLTVKNNTGQAFTGTITLQGNSPVALAGAPFCPPGGAALDTATNLAAGASVTLALGAGGSVTSPAPADTSNCGGFNFDQQQPLINDPNQPAVFKANNDDFVVKCSNCNAGDVATFRPVPVPQPLFTVATGSTVGSGTTCVTFADFSSPNAAQPNGVCPLFQTHCLNGGVTCGDADSFNWKGTADFIIDQNTIPNPIGGVHFLGDPGVNCAASLTYSTDIALSYTGVQPGTDAPPLTGGSGGGLNCFAVTYDTTAAAIPIGVTESALGGPFSPVDPPPAINIVNIPSSVPLPFFVANGVGGAPITNLQLCPGGPTAPGSSTCITPGVSKPWAYLARVPLACPNAAAGFVNTATQSDSVTTVAGLVPATPAGTFNYIWQIKKTETPNTCASVNIVTSSGAALIPYANFEFVNK